MGLSSVITPFFMEYDMSEFLKVIDKLVAGEPITVQDEDILYEEEQKIEALLLDEDKS